MKRFRLKKNKLPTEFYLLIFIIIIVETIIYSEISILYVVDVYNYLYQANKIALTGNFFSYISRGFPFVWFLAALMKITSVNAITIFYFSKLIMFGITLICYSLIYLSIKLITNNRIIPFFSVLFILIDPSFIEYSLIAYFEPFTFLLAWLSIFLTIKYFYTNSKKFFILGIIFSLITGLVRFEMFLIITFPILVVFLYRELKLKKEKKFLATIMIIMIALFLLFYQILIEYYSSVTRYDFMTRSFMGVTNIDVVSNTIISIFSITNEIILNRLFGVICIIGLILFLKKIVIEHHKNKITKEFSSLLSIRYRSHKTAKEFSLILYIFITFLTIFVSINFYGFTYQIIDNQIYINTHISTRNQMNSKIFLIPLFIYGLYEIITKISQQLIIYIQKIPKIIDIKKRMSNFKLNVFKFKNKSAITILCCIFSIYSIYFPFMWSKGIQNVQNNCVYMEAFDETGIWLEYSLEKDDLVFVPYDYMFYIISPNIKENILSYDYIWEKSGVVYKADITLEEWGIVRKTLIDEIKNNTNIKYLVVDWISKTKNIFNLNITDELFDLIFLTHTVKVSSGTYRPSILIYSTI